MNFEIIVHGRPLKNLFSVWKYTLKKLKYLYENCFEKCSFKRYIIKHIQRCENRRFEDTKSSVISYHTQAKIETIYRVTRRNDTIKKDNDVRALDGVSGEKTGNLLLLHGTSLENSVAIIKEGCIQSKKGKFGQGVYLTAR